MFKFFDKKSVLVFSSDSISQVEDEALKYKLENNLKLVEILKNNGRFYKWI